MTDPRPARELDKLIIRLPDGMRDKLATVARNQGRSANAEVVQALESWLTRDPQRRPDFAHLPEPIRDKLVASARVQKRSVLDEVVARLAASYEPKGQRDADPAQREFLDAMRDAMHEVLEGVLGDPEKRRQLGLRSKEGPGGEDPVTG